MNGRAVPEPYRAVGIYHRIVVPIVLALIGFVLFIGSLENLSALATNRRGIWITLIVVGGMLVVGSAALFVYANLKHQRAISADSASADD